jgi:RNA polymerase sigma-70 factor (ECF subfamily)
VGLHGGWVHRLAVVIVGSEEAADVTQDVLLRAWRELPRLRDDRRFEAWLRRILVNRCRDLGRAQGRRVVEIELDPAVPGAAPSADRLGAADRAVDLDAALARLSVDQRAVIALHFAADLTLGEVAATLGVPIGTVKSRLNAALIHLRAELGRDDSSQ